VAVIDRRTTWIRVACILLAVVAVALAVMTRPPTTISQSEAEKIAAERFRIFLSIKNLTAENFDPMQSRLDEMGWHFVWKSNDRLGSFTVFVDKRGDHWDGSDVAP
jgi:hypothetical protein